MNLNLFAMQATLLRDAGKPGTERNGTGSNYIAIINIIVERLIINDSDVLCKHNMYRTYRQCMHAGGVSWDLK